MSANRTSPINNNSVNICLNTDLDNFSKFLLPVIEIGVQGPKGPKVKFNALLDTGSSRSYLSKPVMNKLKLEADKSRNSTGCKRKIMHFVNSQGAFVQVFKLLRERHVPRPQMISSILFLPIGGHIGWYI